MRSKSILLVILLMLLSVGAIYAFEILTIFEKSKAYILSQKANEIQITKNGLKEAKNIADALIATLSPKTPAAGLAAPQIGIAKQVFIFSWDRSMENMQVVINPKIIHFGKETKKSWEACFSTMQEEGESKAAKVKRSNSITVEYTDLKGHIVKQQLDGFAAKVFQHEYEHLQGIENISKKGSKIQSFSNKAELTEFMKKVTKSDSANYIKPVEL